MRSIDVLGLAVAIVIAGLAQIVTPYSGPWWAAMIVAGLIGLAAAVHLAWSSVPESVRVAIRPLIWKPTGYLRTWVGILLLCLLVGGGYVGSHRSPAGPPSGGQPRSGLALQSRAGKILLTCVIPPSNEKTFEERKKKFAEAVQIYGDAVGLSILLSDVPKGIKLEMTAKTSEGQMRMGDITKITIQAQRISDENVLAVYSTESPSFLGQVFAMLPLDVNAEQTKEVVKLVERLFGAMSGKCQIF
jgi:hypothetical protein